MSAAGQPVLTDAMKEVVTSMGYQPLGFIGEGSCKTVLEARDAKSNTNVAIKCITFKGEGKRLQQKKDAVQREISIVQSLNHENVVKLLGHRLGDDEAYIVMEVLESDLKRHLAAHLLKTADAPLIFLQVAKAVAYLHSNKICHRNIRYKNVLLRADLFAKLRDFGLAKVVSDGVDTHLLNGGHLGYMPPEQFREDLKKDPFKGDIWSLGVMLFMLVFQRYPFSLSPRPFFSKDEMLQALEGKQLTFPERSQPSSDEAEARDLVTKMLQHEPSERPSAASVLEHPWLAGADDKLKAHMAAYAQAAATATAAAAAVPAPVSS